MSGIILASASPRRRELLTQMGITDFTVRPARGEERARPGLPPDELVEQLALQKAREVQRTAGAEDIIIGADTVVALDGAVLGKPKDEAEARAMLRALAGRTHHVYTGLALLHGGEERTAHEETAVTFRPIGNDEIEAYLATGESMDKAGAYGIQGRACVFVSSIRGDYYNVVGLPVCRLSQMLRALAEK